MKNQFKIVSSGVNITLFGWYAVVDYFEAADKEWFKVYEPSIRLRTLKDTRNMAYYGEKLKFKVLNRTESWDQNIEAADYLNTKYYNGMHRIVIQNFQELGLDKILNWTDVRD